MSDCDCRPEWWKMGWVTTWITHHFFCLYFIIPYTSAVNKPKLSPFHSCVSMLLVIFLVIWSLKDRFYPANRCIWRGFVLLSLPACHLKNRVLSCWHLFFQGWGGKLCQGGFSLVFLFYLNTCCNTLHILLDTLQSVQSAPGKSLDISGVIHPSYLVHAFPFVSPADAFNCQPLLLAFQEVAEELWSPSGEGWNKGAQQCYDIFLHWIGFGKNGLFPPVR